MVLHSVAVLRPLRPGLRFCDPHANRGQDHVMASRKSKLKTGKNSAKTKKAKRTKSAANRADQPRRKQRGGGAAFLDTDLQTITACVTSDDGAAWLVDPKAATLSPLNSAGAEAFNLEQDAARSIMLDSAMPALKSLQKLASSKKSVKANRTLTQPLLLWTPDGARRHHCRITAHTVQKRTLFVIQQIAKPQDRGGDAKVDRAVDTPVLRDDAAILREIARRIRAGTGADETIDDVPGELPEPTGDNSRPAPDNPNSIRSLEQSAPHQRAKLAHELRAPIAAIAAAAEVLKDEQFGSLDNFQYRDYARDIYQSAQHALKVIENGLSSSLMPSPDNAERNERETNADLNALVSNAVTMVQHLASAKHVTVSFQKSARDVWLTVDATEVTQIVVNFLTNAVKFSSDGATISVEILSNLGEDIIVEVRDTGTGMSASDQDRFNRSNTHRDPERRAGGGYGLGLSLAHALAEANGASIEIDSAPGRGTCARLVFPLRQMMAV